MKKQPILIHGIKQFSKNDLFGSINGIICCSLHQNKKTVPLYNFGYILKLDKENYVNGFAKDVCSLKAPDGQRELSKFSFYKKSYEFEDIDKLLLDTKVNKHNELWINGFKAKIIGGYYFNNNQIAHGIRVFKRKLIENKLPLIKIN